MNNMHLNELVEYFDKGDTVNYIHIVPIERFAIIGFIQWREEWQNNITYRIFKIEDKRTTLCYVGDDYNQTQVFTCRLVLTEKLNKKI